MKSKNNDVLVLEADSVIDQWKLISKPTNRDDALNILKKQMEKNTI